MKVQLKPFFFLFPIGKILTEIFLQMIYLYIYLFIYYSHSLFIYLLYLLFIYLFFCQNVKQYFNE